MKVNIYGGKLDVRYADIDVVVEVAKELGITVGKSEDLSDLRSKGACVPRAELDNQPTFEGYCGPMWDGGCLRYETWEIYNMLSD